MTHATLTADIEDWLIGKALSDPDIVALFETLCNRLRAIGIPLDRASFSWPTLHPLFKSEQVFWRVGEGAEFQQYIHSTTTNSAWLRSPLHHATQNRLATMRRRLTGPEAMLDFDVLKDFQSQGFTDYLVTLSAFRIADVEGFEDRETGMIASWASKRENGFTEADIDALRRIQRLFAVASRAAIQKRVMVNLATAYLGPTAARRVLAGDIRRGDGDRIPAVLWFSDLRGSTKLSDRLGADDYLALINRYFECTAAAVVAHGGEVLNFIGDGVFAIFPFDGAPEAAAARAEATVQAAMAQQCQTVAEGVPGNTAISFGIGLSVGDVMFGNIGVPDRLAFSAIGRSVNALHRIEAATKTLGIPVLADREFSDLAPGAWREVGEIAGAELGGRVPLFAPVTMLPDGDAAPEPAPQSEAEV